MLERFINHERDNSSRSARRTPGVLLTSVVAVAASLLAYAAVRAAEASPPPSCLAGAYRAADGQLLALAPVGDSALRYKLTDGSTGQLYSRGSDRLEGGPGWAAEPPPVAAELVGTCSAPSVQFRRGKEALAAATRVPLTVTETVFEGAGLKLAGRLVMPRTDGPVPVVVLVQGSGSNSAVREQLDQYVLPANGIGVFVYDKRGTGRSQGTYTQAFDLLARDAAAAVAEARRLAGGRVARIGFWGSSQGGWVSPLAATMTPVDFVVVSYGLTEGPAGEDREQVFFELRKAGFGPDAIAKAREITAATTRVIASRFTDGFDELAAVKKKYRHEPWFGQINGEYTGGLLRNPEFAIRLLGPKRDRGTPWNYDPEPALVAFRQPMLWVLAGDDDDAPSDTTLQRLRALQDERPLLDVAVYPGTTHGIVYFWEDKDGKRTPQRYAESYQKLVVDWVKSGSLRPSADVVLYPGAQSRSAQRPF